MWEKLKQHLATLKNHSFDTKSSLLLHSDSLKILPQIPDNSIDFILTDPPYFINEEVSIIRRGNQMKYKGKDIDFMKNTEWDRVWSSKDEYHQWLKKVIFELSRILKPDRHIVLFCDKKDISYIAEVGEEFGLKFRTPWFWRKTNPVPQARKISPMKSIEVAVWFTKGKPKDDFYNWQLGMITDVIDCPIPQNEGALERHPTQKPLFFGMLLTAFLSKPDEIVFDPFMGAGTFIISAITLNRKAIGIEVNEKYFNIAIHRIKNGLARALQEKEKLRQFLLSKKPSSVSLDEFTYLFEGISRGRGHSISKYLL